MIVVDGRTDEEKLVELLGAGAEETALDFKSTLDLGGRTGKGSVEFAKDVISMGNLPTGGYIVVGVDDRGQPAHGQAPVDAKQFDSAKLREKVMRYVEAPMNLISQAHQVDDRTVIIIFVEPNADGLPVPTCNPGEYDRGDGEMKKVFTAGEVLIREGTSNVRLRYAHWNGLLERYREAVKAEARRDTDELVRRLVESFRSSGGRAPTVPLDAAMDDPTLTEALVALLESGSTIRVQQFLNDATVPAGAGDSDERPARVRALDQITLIACQAAVYRKNDVFKLAVDALERAYAKRLLTADSVGWAGNDRSRAEHYLDILVRVYTIGALVVRQSEWSLLPTLAKRSLNESGYEWPSWLRHAVTMAARAGLLQDDDGRSRGGQVISLSRALAAQRPGLRPDYSAETTLPKAEDLAHDDWLLNSLCEFDLWWCIIARASRPDDREAAAFYPSSAAFHQWRSVPTLNHIATDPTVRQAAFKGASDQEIADAMASVVGIAINLSHQYGGWWDGFHDAPRAGLWIQDHATATS